MAVSQDSAELTLELVRQNSDEIGGVAEFAGAPAPDGTTEGLILDAVTWRRMGYPHFVTATIKTTKS